MSSGSVQLPAGWRLVRLGNALKLLNGYSFKPTEWSKVGRPIIRIQNLKSADAPYNYFAGELPARYQARPGDLLFAWSGTPGTSFGAHVWSGPEAWINQHIFRVDFSSNDFDRDFLKLALDFNLDDYIANAQGGVGLAHITKTKLDNSQLLAPPLEDQRNIARTVNAIGAERVSALRRLQHSHRALQRFRNAVLAAACTGRLTAEWREEHRREAHQLAQDLRNRSALRRKQLAEPQPHLVEDLPAEWEVVALDLMIDRIEAGKSFSALGRPATDVEWGVIKVSAMSWGRFLEDENKAVPEDRPINPAYEIKTGDLLLSRANTEDLVGATVLVVRTRPRLLLSDKSLRLVPHPGINREWLNFILQSRPVRRQCEERATGTSDSMRNLSQAKILATTMPLPSTAEQEEIARRVEKLLSLAHKLQQRIEAAERRVDRSSHAVLAKAFRGELIPTVADQPRPKTGDALGSEGSHGR